LNREPKLENLDGVERLENDQFTDQLVAWDEALAAGTAPSTEAQAHPTPVDDERLAKGVACLKLLRQVRGARKSDSGIRLLGLGSGSASPLADFDGSPMLGKQFGRFEIRQELGRGGYGAVFLAHDPQLRRDVALKVPHAGVLMKPELRARFKQEARAAAGLDHPHIVQVYEAGDLGPVCYMASAYCPGTNLAEWLYRRRDLPTYQDTAELVASLADAMQHAHERGVWHRDLKPANVILQLKSTAPTNTLSANPRAAKPSSTEETPEPSPLGAYLARITDFGLAKTMDDASLNTMSGSILGTPSYMAPEQAVGKAHPMAAEPDIYSLGGILYELLTGHLPFQGDSPLDTLRQVIHEEPVPPTRIRRTVPRDLETICLKCLEKDPRARYWSAQELADDLRRYLRSEPIHARSVSSIERVWRACRRKPMTAGLSTALAMSIVVSLIAVSVLWRQAEHRRGETADALNKVSEVNQTVTAERDQSEAMRYLHDIALVQSELSTNITRSRQILESCRPELRNWEWYFLNRLSHIELLTLGNHSLHACSVDVSNDGRFIATSSGQWGVGMPGEIFLWDAKTGERLAEFHGHRGAILDVDFHPNGKLLASSDVNFVDRDAACIRIWDLERKEDKVVITGGTGFFDVEFSRDGRFLVTAGADGRCRVIDTNNWKQTRPLNPHTQSAFSVSFHPDCKRVASCSRDGTASIWDITTGSELIHLEGQGDLRQIAFSPDGRHFATSSFIGNLKVRDTETGNELSNRVTRTTRIVKIAFSPDGTSIALTTRNTATEIWNLLTGELLKSFPGHYPGTSGVAYTPDGARLITTGVDGQARVWNAIAEPNPREVRIQSSYISHMAIVPKTNFLAVASTRHTTIPGIGVNDFTLRLVDQSSARVVRRMTGHTNWLTCVAASVDGKQLASGSEDCTVRLWNVTSDKPVATLDEHSALVNSVAILTNGHHVVSASADHTLKVWDTAKSESVKTLDDHDGSVTRVVCDPQGRWFASASDDMTVRIWDATSFQAIATLKAHQAPVLALAVSLDGKLLASAGRERVIHFWDLDAILAAKGPLTGKPAPVRTAETHDGQIGCLSFSPDGKRLVSASLEGADSTIRLWNVQTAQETIRLAAIDRAPATAVFSESGEYLFLTFGSQLQIFDAQRQLPGPQDRLQTWDTKRIAWHQKAARDAESTKRWFEAAFHLSHLLQNESTQNLLQRRSTAYAELERWSDASMDLQKALELRDNSYLRTLYALMRLSLGDNTSYQQLIDEMHQHYAKCTNPADANNYAWTGAFSATYAEANSELLASRADFAVRNVKSPAELYGHMSTQGFALMRAKKYSEALAVLNEAIRIHGQGGDVSDWMIVAMTQHHLGQIAEAKAGLEKSIAELKARQEKPGKDTWFERAQNGLLLREAQQLIK
jgi:WD40 repeat protein